MESVLTSQKTVLKLSEELFYNRLEQFLDNSRAGSSDSSSRVGSTTRTVLVEPTMLEPPKELVANIFSCRLFC